MLTRNSICNWRSNTAYDRAGYDLTVNYRLAPEVALTAEQDAWADQLLKAKGLR